MEVFRVPLRFDLRLHCLPVNHGCITVDPRCRGKFRIQVPNWLDAIHVGGDGECAPHLFSYRSPDDSGLYNQLEAQAFDVHDSFSPLASYSRRGLCGARLDTSHRMVLPLRSHL